MKSIPSTLPVLALLTLGACSGDGSGQSSGTAQSALGPTDVATIGDERLPESVFRLYSMNTLQRNVEQLSDDEHEQLLDELIRFKVLAQAAEQRGLLQERRIAAELELQRMQLLGQRMAVRYLEENPPTEAELREVYEANIDQYRGTEHKARHILVDSEEEAREIIAQLDSGTDFEELAQDRSTGSTASEGGDLGYFEADSMVEPFSRAVTNMDVGTYSSEPVQTRYGWHVILLEDIREEEAPGLDAVRSEVRRQAEMEKLEAFVESLKSELTVEINSLD